MDRASLDDRKPAAAIVTSPSSSEVYDEHVAERFRGTTSDQHGRWPFHEEQSTC